MTKSAAQQDHEIEVLNQVILAIHRQTIIPRDVMEMWCSLETPPLRADELETFIKLLSSKHTRGSKSQKYIRSKIGNWARKHVLFNEIMDKLKKEKQKVRQSSRQPRASKITSSMGKIYEEGGSPINRQALHGLSSKAEKKTKKLS